MKKYSGEANLLHPSTQPILLVGSEKHEGHAMRGPDDFLALFRPHETGDRPRLQLSAM